MRFSILKLVLASAVALALLVPAAVAQETTGNIAGVVKDPSGAVLPDVNVTVLNKATNRTIVVKTSAVGAYQARDLAPGRYSITFEKSGFSKSALPDVLLLLGKTVKADMELAVGTVATTVEISANAQLIDTSSTMVAHNVTAEELDNLPKGRNFQGIALLSTSVNTGQLEGGYQINGATAAENNYYIDGVSTVSQIDGSARQNATFEYIQEVQVKTAGLEAEYGGALGGVVTAVTRSGGNNFHGEAHYYYYGNALSAGPVQRLQIDPLTGTSASFIQDEKQKSDNHEFGGSLGGPIVKNRLWFFSSFSPRYLRQTNNYLFDNGQTPGSMSRTAYFQNWFNKISWDPTNRIRTNFTWLYTPQRLTGSLYGYDGMGSTYSTSDVASAAGSSTRGYHQPEQSYTAAADFTLSNTSLLSVKGGRYYLDYKELGVPYRSYAWWRGSSIGMAGVPADLQKAFGYATPSAAQTLWDITTRTYAQADFSQFLKFAGTHNIKVGVGTTKNVNNVNISELGPDGRILLYWGQTCASCVAPKTGTYGYYVVQDYAIKGSTGANINHFYIQDSWRVLPRLTINVGLRTEKETIPSFQRSIKDYAFRFGWGDKLAPRIGASFDVFGDGRLKVSGAWGRFYDWTKYDLARGTFGAEVWVDYYRTLDTTDVLSLNLNNMPGQNIWPGVYRNRRVPGFEYVDPEVKPMSADNMNTGVEYEVKPGTLFSARWTRNKLNRTIEDMGFLDATGSEQYGYGNPGEGRYIYGPVSGDTCTTKINNGQTCVTLMPKAERVYDAMELSLTRRFTSGWFANFSYVYSKLWGNYAGLQNTDEIRPPNYGAFGANQGFFSTGYRPGGNASRSWDLDEVYYDAHGNAGVYGRLPTDRPHVFKFYGSKTFKTGTEIGGFYRIMSGTPITTLVASMNDIPLMVEGRGDAGRNPVFSQTDLLVAQEFKFGEVKRLRFEFNASNLFNQKTNMYTFQNYNREDLYDTYGIDLSGTDLNKGFDWKSMVNALGSGAHDPRFGKAAWFNPGFAGRVMVKFIF
ncbi:MAG: TonB-dependent receptor [Acidobacteriales bacterium]|nr:TonB-dependent receptor [Terriglobales bacterium]